MRLDELENKIKIYSKIYYEGLDSYDGLTPIPDDEFDKLIEELRSIDPNHWILTAPGWGYNLSSDKEAVNHILTPITGIDNKTKDKDYTNLYIQSRDVVLTPKLDGCSVILTYRKGTLTAALSRGNGVTGSNILDIISQIPSVPHNIDDDGLLVIRGELIFQNLNDEDQGNIRNQANGLIMRKNYTLSTFDKEHFLFLPYHILNASDIDKEKELYILEKLGFYPIPSFRAVHECSWEDGLNTYKEVLSDNGRFPIDGIIIEDNSEPYKTGPNSPYSRDILAFKFNSSMEETEVTGIDWRLSNLGKYFPTLHLKEVVLDGARVSKVSGGSYAELRENGLGIGAIVNVVRSGGVIPYIQSVVSPSYQFNEPEDSYVSGAHLFKENFHASDYDIISNFYYWFVGKGYSGRLFNRLYENNESYLTDLVRFREFVDNYEEITRNQYYTGHERDGLGAWIATLRNLKKSTSLLVGISNIDGAGGIINKRIQAAYPLIDDLLSDLECGASVRFCSNSRVNASLHENIELLFRVNDFLKNYEYDTEEIQEPEEEEVDDNKLRVVLTNFGGSPLKKAEFLEKYSKVLREVGSVDECDMVIYSKPGSSTYRAGMDKGKKVVQVLDFIEKTKDLIQ